MLAVLADQHREHQRPAPLAVIGGNAVDLGDRQHEDGRRLEEHHGLTGDRGHRDQRADAGERRSGADGGAAGHHRGEVVLLELVDDLGGRRLGVVLAQPLDVGLDRGGLDAGAALDDLGQRARGRARDRRRSTGSGNWLLALERALMFGLLMRRGGFRLTRCQRTPVAAGCPRGDSRHAVTAVTWLGKKILSSVLNSSVATSPTWTLGRHPAAPG